jgi:hypothetical protein
MAATVHLLGLAPRLKTTKQVFQTRMVQAEGRNFINAGIFSIKAVIIMLARGVRIILR